MSLLPPPTAAEIEQYLRDLQAGSARPGELRELLMRERAALRSLVRRVLEDRVGSDWVREAQSLLGLPAQDALPMPLVALATEVEALEQAAAMLWRAAQSDRWTPEALAMLLMNDPDVEPPAEVVAAIRLASGLAVADDGPRTTDQGPPGPGGAS